MTDPSSTSSEFRWIPATSPAKGVGSTTARGRLLVRRDREAQLRAADFDQLETWQRLLAAGRTREGRGRTQSHELADGTPLRLKQMRRGGIFGPLWRDRYFVDQLRRLTGNVTVPTAAIARGVQTPRPVALFLLEEPPLLYRAWLAFEDVVGAESLMARLKDGIDPAAIEWAMATVRDMHDRGVEHTDLNLGNVLVGPRRGEAWIIDLDKARLHDGALTPAVRQKALDRLERSYRKHLADADPAARRFGTLAREAYGDRPVEPLSEPLASAGDG